MTLPMIPPGQDRKNCPLSEPIRLQDLEDSARSQAQKKIISLSDFDSMCKYKQICLEINYQDLICSCFVSYQLVKAPIFIFIVLYQFKVIKIFTSAEREVTDSRCSGMYQITIFLQDWACKVCRFSVLFGYLTK